MSLKQQKLFLNYLRLIKKFYYINTDEIRGFFIFLKNQILTSRSEDTIFIFHM